MTVRCAAQDCLAIDEMHQIIAADHAGELFLTSPAGNRPLTRLPSRTASPAAYASASGGAIAELITIAPDGQAILSRHTSGAPARAETLFGTCAACLGSGPINPAPLAPKSRNIRGLGRAGNSGSIFKRSKPLR